MNRRRQYAISATIAAATFGLVLTGISQTQTTAEAPTGFDNQTNGSVPQSVHDADVTVFNTTETADEGLGPIFNRDSCVTCHQAPISGGGSTVLETRAGHTDESGNFVNPTVPINSGKDTITGRSLINDQATCPEAQETIPETETIRTKRGSISVLGDGFVEAVPDALLKALAAAQASATGGAIHGQAISVDVLEAPGTQRVGRFGWKNQHASVHSFSADAYLNEMGVTSSLLPVDTCPICDTVADPEDKVEDGLSDVDRFARFIRATKAPPRDPVAAARPDAQAGSQILDAVGCSICHVRTLSTAPAGTSINGGTFTIPPALGGKVFHPFGDYLLHDAETGDGIVQNGGQGTANKIHTAALWGLRTRTQYMHDGASKSLIDAIARHGGEAPAVIGNFNRLSERQQRQILAFLRTL
jgi:CxxC motif-containing protein (DUF1111 family)